MIKKKFLLCVLLATLIEFQGAFADEITIIKSPNEVRIADKSQVSITDIAALPYHLFGLNERQSSLLSDVSFLCRPRLMVMISVACSTKCPVIANDNKHSFAINGDASDVLLYNADAGVRQLLHRLGMQKSVVAHTQDLTESTNANLFADTADYKQLPEIENEAALGNDMQQYQPLIAELRMIQDTVSKLVASKLLADSQPDILHIEINSLANQQSVPDSVQQFVSKFITFLATELDNASGGRAFIAMATMPQGAELMRIGRSLLAATEAPPSPADAMNLAADYSSDFPIMFNLILWLSVILALAVYAIAYSLWNIDPGKDGIVYRRGYAHAKMD